MCGIVAYLGPKSVNSVLMVGLTRLEYRGYDSAGIAAINRGELAIRKERGKIKDLEDLLRSHPLEGNIGLGHTRWATHGEPSRLNAHPHSDSQGKIALVHNGIIENYHHLRNVLRENDHIFHTETDSEVIPHLLEEEYKTTKNMPEALQAAIEKLEGKYAFTFIFDEQPDRIYFARNGSPLVYGQNKGESYLASDVAAVIPGARESYSIENGQWGWITRGDLHLFNGTGKELPFELAKIELNVKDLDRGGYSHFMEKEIFEQPGMLRRIIDYRVGENGKVNFPEMQMPLDFLNKLSRTLITSAGTSLYAGMLGKMYLERFARVATEVDISSEFRYRNPLTEGDTLVIAISQSGETADTLAGVHEAKAKFCQVLSFVNNTNSTIARDSDAYIDLLAGPEIGVASTKAYTAQIMHLLFFSLFVSGIKWIATKDDRKDIFDEIRKIPNKIEQILEKADQLKEWARNFSTARDFIFLGRNYNHPTALEGALKLKEISYIHASGYAGGEFKHGPIALIDKDVPALCIAPKTEVYEKIISNIEEVKARKGQILAICTEGDEKIPQMTDHYFTIPECPDYLTPLLAVIPLQLLAYYAALERGCEPDQPRNLAKSVTVE